MISTELQGDGNIDHDQILTQGINRQGDNRWSPLGGKWSKEGQDPWSCKRYTGRWPHPGNRAGQDARRDAEGRDAGQGWHWGRKWL